MKKLIALAVLALSIGVAQAQQLMSVKTLVADTYTSITTYPIIVDNVNIINATTNTATLNFYDSATTNSTYVQAAYTTYASYATNYNVVITNANGYVYTNTFSGIYTCPTAVAIATNDRTKMTVVLPANTTLNKDVKMQTLLGLNVIADQAVTVITTYRKPY